MKQTTSFIQVIFLFLCTANSLHAMDESGAFSVLATETLLNIFFPSKHYTDIIESFKIYQAMASTNTKFKQLFDSMKDLIKNANLYNEHGYTPLMNAIDNNNLSEIQQLIANGADLNKPDQYRTMDPLKIAIHRKSTQIVSLLLDNGACVDNPQRTTNSESPFFNAMCGGCLEIAELLVLHGADVNEATFYNRRTALHIAAEKGREAQVIFLVNHGADINTQKDATEKTALQLANEPRIKTILRTACMSRKIQQTSQR